MKRTIGQWAKNGTRALAVGAVAVGLTAAMTGSANAAQQEFWWGGNRAAIDNSPGSGTSWAWINDEYSNNRAACVEMYFSDGWTGSLCDTNGAHNDAEDQVYTGGDVVRFRMYEMVNGTPVASSYSGWRDL